MKQSTLPAILLLIASTFVWVKPSHAGLVIGGWDASRNSFYGIEGAGSSQLDADIAAEFPGATITSTGTLTSSYLSTINFLVIGDITSDDSATTALSTAEQTALLNFVKGGGSAIITVDNDSFQSGASAVNNSYISAFGLHVTGTLDTGQATATSTVGPILNGPFGHVTTLYSDFPGYFDSLGSNATSLADLNANGLPLVAEIAPGALGTGSGGVLFVSDSMLIDGSFDQADNQTLINNTIAAFASVPEPTSLLMLGFGIAPVLVLAHRRSSSARRV